MRFKPASRPARFDSIDSLTDFSCGAAAGARDSRSERTFVSFTMAEAGVSQPLNLSARSGPRMVESEAVSISILDTVILLSPFLSVASIAALTGPEARIDATIDLAASRSIL